MKDIKIRKSPKTTPSPRPSKNVKVRTSIKAGYGLEVRTPILH